MRINSQRLESLLLEMLAEVRGGPFEDVSMCVFEHAGLQVQVKVTSDPNEFIGVVTTGVVERLDQAGPSFDDFIDQIKAAGVTIEGEATLRSIAAGSADWTEEVVRCAQQGRKEGIRFTRPGADAPSDEQLAAIIRGYPFQNLACTQVVGNIAIA